MTPQQIRDKLGKGSIVIFKDDKQTYYFKNPKDDKGGFFFDRNEDVKYKLYKNVVKINGKPIIGLKETIKNALKEEIHQNILKKK